MPFTVHLAELWYPTWVHHRHDNPLELFTGIILTGSGGTHHKCAGIGTINVGRNTKTCYWANTLCVSMFSVKEFTDIDEGISFHPDGYVYLKDAEMKTLRWLGQTGNETLTCLTIRCVGLYNNTWQILFFPGLWTVSPYTQASDLGDFICEIKGINFRQEDIQNCKTCYETKLKFASYNWYSHNPDTAILYRLHMDIMQYSHDLYLTYITGECSLDVWVVYACVTCNSHIFKLCAI